ncbi:MULTISPECIES: ABC transporter permease [unclassified Bradyrhizobium]|uniref:ABC transporter permease n=1 Tax=unclassified Bradyrhizobium TaxID=2631580 RepID=UPI001FF9493D|nr:MULTISPECIES: ABC transporter permease [unclassified Bradyrhizobium]MCK1440568.1 ABC transporter permease [Bradyrhizobium sp. 15]MCK1676768.1 ABC transporter permease [Bradyrhizobium sp. 150]
MRAQTLFMSPAALVAFMIVLPPLLYVLYTSLGGPAFSLAAYRDVVTSGLFMRMLSTTLIVAASASLLSLLMGFVVSLHLARQPAKRRTVLMVLVLLPLWTSILVKCFAFTIILGRDGIINSVLSWIFDTKIQLPLVLNRIGLLVGMTNYLIPLAVLPILASLLAIDPAIYRAAAIMGAKPARIFWTVTVPMSLPGVFAGLLSIFVMSLGAFVIPALLGGTHDQMLSNLVNFYNREVLDWPKASAISVVLLGMATVFAAPLVLWRRRKV